MREIFGGFIVGLIIIIIIIGIPVTIGITFSNFQENERHSRFMTKALADAHTFDMIRKEDRALMGAGIDVLELQPRTDQCPPTTPTVTSKNSPSTSATLSRSSSSTKKSTPTN